MSGPVLSEPLEDEAVIVVPITEISENIPGKYI